MPKWFLDDMKKQPKSQTNATCEICIMGTDEVLTWPVKQSTTVFEIKSAVAIKLGIDPGNLTAVMKQGCHWRVQADCEEVARKIYLKGIKSFTRSKHTWPSPIAIIGTGHAGLRQAMWFLKHKEFNFVVYDRKGVVGGTSWLDQANETSKLQTELGTYHLQYDEDNPVPKNMSTWPSTAELVKHFQEVAEEYGIMPYAKMCTNVKEMVIKTKTRQEQSAEMSATGQTWASQTYTLTLEPTDGTGDGRGDNIGATGEPCFQVDHSAVIMYPGNLTLPKHFELKGEENFEGPISYAIMNDFDYNQTTGKRTGILGHGAFAVENLRTCLEYSCQQVYMICRRKNLSCPRVVSWLINQTVTPLTGPLTMRSFMPAYNLIGFDPWVCLKDGFLGGDCPDMLGLVPADVLAAPPSREDGIDEDAEDQLRRFGGGLIQRAGVLLKLPQLAVVTASSLFQRFYFRKSFADFDVRAVCMASVTLASKLQEHPRKVVDVIQVFYKLKMREAQEEDGSGPSFAGKPTPVLDVSAKEFHNAKKELLSAERNILRELGFEVNSLDHPHRYALEYMEQLQRPAELTQKVWNYLNDALQTPLCCAHGPQQIAGAGLVLASKELGVMLPSKPPWWEQFGVQIKDAESIATEMEGLYQKKPAEYIEIPRRKRDIFEPMTPCPSPPGAAMSPEEEEDAENGDLLRQDSQIDLDRLEEVMAPSLAEAEAKGPPVATGEEKPEAKMPQEPAKAEVHQERPVKDRRKRERMSDRSDSGSPSPSKRKSAKKPEVSRKANVKERRERRAKRSSSSASRRKKR
eukprot:symbB.v1.2.030916.t1/scaffold3532.1/size54609/2